MRQKIRKEKNSIKVTARRSSRKIYRSINLILIENSLNQKQHENCFSSIKCDVMCTYEYYTEFKENFSPLTCIH